MSKFIILSHTHWDREWYMPFEQFRTRLVDLIDNLLEIIKKDKRFIFHLDAQTVVLEDYLEIRPENEKLLKKYISSGNIVVGPWYLQNDFYLTSGEATVRNLLYGTEIAEKFGNCAKVAYAPDQFGNISQLPQIFSGFGMDNFMFGRGYSFYDEDGTRKKALTEFIWKGADGSECLAVHLNQWYNNAQRIPSEIEKAKLLLDINEKVFSELNLSPYVVLMNGVDHLEAQEDVLEIADKLRKDGIDVEQCRMDDYFKKLKGWIKKNKAELPVFSGALNHGKDDELLRGCWAARINLKRENVAAQTKIENEIEPLYSYLERKGLSGIYPSGYTNYIWKNLLKNHPHDSICCCSRDEVARHMEDSYARIGEVSNEVLRRGLKALAHHSYLDNGEYFITVFNSTEREYNGIVESEIRFLSSDNVKAFKILDKTGAECEVVVLESKEDLYDVFTGTNLPGVLNVTNYKILFKAENIAPFSSEHFTVCPVKAFSEIVGDNSNIENDYYRICTDGENVSLYIKETGKTINNIIKFEDTGDFGDLYIYNPAGKEIYDKIEKISITENNNLRKTICVNSVLKVPEKYNFTTGKRTAKRVVIPISYSITLTKNSRTVSVSYRFENSAEDHRIRMIINGGVDCEAMTVDSPFDCTNVKSSDICSLAKSKTFCNSTFAAKRENGVGFALFTEGQHEVESVKDGIAVTCLRAIGTISRGAGSQWQTPEGQCKGNTFGRIGIYMFNDNTDADLFAYAKQFRVGLKYYYDSSNHQKFSGGRFAVQDAKLAKFYPEKDKFEGKIIEQGALFTMSNNNIAVTAVKKSKNGTETIVRLVNLSNDSQTCNFSYSGKISCCRIDETRLYDIGNGSATLEFTPKQIITLMLK